LVAMYAHLERGLPTVLALLAIGFLASLAM
jgi:hypothetical protein